MKQRSLHLASQHGNIDIIKYLIPEQIHKDITAIFDKKPHRGTLTIRGGDEQSGLAFFVH
jgi:hypothetical protein